MASSFGGLRPRRSVFVSYHHGGDQTYYDTFSRIFHDTYEAVRDNSLERAINSEDVDYVRRQIREKYITGTSCTFVLVGARTYGRKYVDWEIEASLDKCNGLIGVQLPTLPVDAQGKVQVPERLSDNINSGFALWISWNELTTSVQACSDYIELANARNRGLIDNSRGRRLRNA